ncbi:putative CmcJ-like methyltransferase [Lophiotrema nucula]|uniref:Putative CmcJ-like methyltransferase n=1 Tax=Lophiotrema nucula TaxID=690887 RepID=A0A6A5YMG0_9PLEO|nr:putative CmcJ-like methyltransferase [Lophiotrema nucula]
MSKHIKSSIHFLTPSTLHHVEKPYAFRYAVDGFPQTNFENGEVHEVNITDIRGHEEEFKYDTHGFAVLHLKQHFEYDIFWNETLVQAYFYELEIILKEHLHATEVRVFRHGLRKRDPAFPISTGESYAYDQPTSVAHIDTTPKEAANEIRRQYGGDADQFLKRRHQWVNIWKPLKGPLNDWPLAVCASSTLTEKNIEAADLLYPDLATENYQVYYSKDYQWYYLSDHDVSEIIIFKQSDSNPSACPGVAHCSFYNPRASTHELPRESIEVRALAFFE